MKTINKDLIKESEGLVLKAYLPTPDDVWTIGYGHTSGVTRGMTITKEQAEQFLEEDLKWVERVIDTSVKVPLNQNQYDALASFIYNLGGTNFRNSTLLRKLNSGDYKGAANEFPKWNKQRQKDGKLVPLAGLTKRRAKEQALFLTPVEPTLSSELGGAAVVGGAGAVAAYQGLDSVWIIGILLVGILFVAYSILKKRKKSQ